jgi:RNA-directed DNA polymerase
MNVAMPKRDYTRATTDFNILWNKLNWSQIEAKVSKLQSRIAKAVGRGRYNLVKKLQYLLTNSFHAKLLAVRKVTTNKGKNTPGIDGVILSTPSSKYKTALKLSNKGYKPLPLKRIHIKKSNGKNRPLSIATMNDRAMQTLHQFALDPIAEVELDKRSFGFRKYRSTKDAGEYLFKILSRKNAPKYILEGDIKGMFDNISQAWIKENIQINGYILNKFLSSGYVYQNKLFPTKRGVGQGSSISPTISNLTLNGLGDRIRSEYWKSIRGTIHQRHNKFKVHIAIYADDFVVTSNNQETLEEIKILIESFLAKRGLELSKEKTVITHIDKGFDFLGWNFRKYNNKLIIKPSKASIKKVKVKIKETIIKHNGHRQDLLIIKLNQIITGWCNYHKHMCAKEVFNEIDSYIFERLWKWAKRRHPKKNMKWIKKRYFVRIENRDWIFKSEINQLKFMGKFKITRHIIIKLDNNPYFPEHQEYYRERRLAKS